MKKKKKAAKTRKTPAKKKEKVNFVESREGSFKENYVTGAIGGINFGTFVMNFYADHPVPEDAMKKTKKVNIERTFKTRLVMSPMTAKSVADWIYKHLKAGEKDSTVEVTPSISRKKDSSEPKGKQPDVPTGMYG